mmetsp:Transcript_42184/g.106217  ORF Transcript_42184/g.106217 Transcript_42184/m.106217 type:complete len:222 (-) Transcript_42184:3-668(-)
MGSLTNGPCGSPRRRFSTRATTGFRVRSRCTCTDVSPGRTRSLKLSIYMSQEMSLLLRFRRPTGFSWYPTRFAAPQWPLSDGSWKRKPNRCCKWGNSATSLKACASSWSDAWPHLAARVLDFCRQARTWSMDTVAVPPCARPPAVDLFRRHRNCLHNRGSKARNSCALVGGEPDIVAETSCPGAVALATLPRLFIFFCRLVFVAHTMPERRHRDAIVHFCP